VTFPPDPVVAGTWGAEELHILLDDSALVAAGRGNVLASRLIDRAHSAEADRWHLYTTACAVVAADRERRGTGRHVAALPALVVVPLDLPAALEVMAAGDWSLPHTRYAAQPSVDLPDGAIVATARPDLWRGQPVRVLDITP
jgi:hypothetical protein